MLCHSERTLSEVEREIEESVLCFRMGAGGNADFPVACSLEMTAWCILQSVLLCNPDRRVVIASTVRWISSREAHICDGTR